MSRYIDADDLKERILIFRKYYRDVEHMDSIEFNKRYRATDVLMNILEMINEQPIADVVEVVRCKDCVYYENFLCSRFSAYGNSVEEPEYDYCSYGERREDDKGRSG